MEGETSWYSVSVFRVLAEHAFASLHKGERVIVTGRLRIRQWETSVKKGVTAEIDADALGHDLLFGTTRFERSHGTSSPAAEPRSSVEAPSPDTQVNRWTAPQIDGEPVWANPGVDERSTAQALADSSERDIAEDAPERELVMTPSETPF